MALSPFSERDIMDNTKSRILRSNDGDDEVKAVPDRFDWVEIFGASWFG